jgi:hypothetical protein
VSWQAGSSGSGRLAAGLLFSALAVLALILWLSAGHATSSPRGHAASSPRFAAAGPLHPVRTPQGALRRGVRDQIYTENWSGYTVAKFETGQSYGSAAGTWIVPKVSNVSGFSNTYSSSWVGIGGFCLNSSCSSVDSTLIQLGTEQDASSTGATQYYAWYELSPKFPVQIPLTINPGDKITASLVDPPKAGGRDRAPKSKPGGPGGGPRSKGQTWTLTMVDQTTGHSWSTTVSYNSSLDSAEWIEEAPYSGGILPLANYGTATFDPGTVGYAANPALPENPGLAPGNAVVMLDPNGQTSNPSGPDSDTDGFDTCWGSGSTLTACSAPSS